MNGKRILVVDDHEDQRIILHQVLSYFGYSVTLASDGRQALESLGRRDADLVLLDLCLPGMTGWELLRRMREDARLAAIPVVACTDFPRRELPRAPEHAALRALLPKPIRLSSLLETVGGLLGVPDEGESVLLSGSP